MTELIKSHWVTEGDNIRLSMPLAKVDEQNRLVSGWATLDNIDTQGDIVTAEASVKAFSRARGNLREMHQPIAVGKVVDFREKEFYDENDGKFYRGVFVTAKVSVGAESTWQKVLDGTLSGFSIGGSIIDSTNEMSKDGNKPVRIVKDFDLVELSLVDNPANQLANIDSIQKNIFTLKKDATGSVTVEGMAAEMTIENVFICPVHSKIVSTVEESANCPECDLTMESIGWFEQTGNSEDRAEKVRETVAKFRTPNNKTGGDEMTDEVTKSAEETGTKPDAVDATGEESAEVKEVVDDPQTDALDEDNLEDGATDVDEVTDESEELSKRIDELKTTLSDILEKKAESHDAAIKSLEDKIESISSSFMEKASELENKLDQFGDKLEVEKKRLSDFEKKLEKFNSSEAVKKSAELEKAAEPVQKKTTWDGAFSIDNLR